MDHESLRTAATYLNNLLLARGLLRNGEPVDFVKPSKDSRAQIINLVHDLILREDRARDQREHAAVTLRTLRAEDNRKAHEIERLTGKCEEAAHRCASAQSVERAAQVEAKKVDKAMKVLQEQASKLKTQLAQVKTQCVNDVRKRDLELAKLKAHLQGQQRGNKAAVAAPSISITRGNAANGVRQRSGAHAGGSVHELGDPEYSLKQETTEFLTQLSQSLSDENDSLISLIRSSLATMRDLLGLPATHDRLPDSAIGSEDGKPIANANMLQTLPTAFDTLEAGMNGTLTQLKTVLTNPNFVSVDEVEMREEEIARLRDGWERMEQRWKDVLLMMQGWLRRMDTGDTINIDDLKRGMGLVSPAREIHGLEKPQNGRGKVSAEDSEISIDGSEIKLPSSIRRNEDGSSLVAGSGSAPTDLVTAASKRKRDLLDPPALFDLRPQSQTASSPGHDLPELGGEISDGDVEEEEVEEENRQTSVPDLTVAEKLAQAQTEADRAAATGRLQAKDTLPHKARGASQASTKGNRLAAQSPLHHADLFSSPGADRAEQSLRLDGTADHVDHAKDIDERMIESKTDPPDVGVRGDGDGEGEGEGEGEEGDTLPPFSPLPVVKKIRIRGRPRKKRKSTLSPDELEALMVGVEEGE